MFLILYGFIMFGGCRLVTNSKSLGNSAPMSRSFAAAYTARLVFVYR